MVALSKCSNITLGGKVRQFSQLLYRKHLQPILTILLVIRMEVAICRIELIAQYIVLFQIGQDEQLHNARAVINI